VSRSGSTPTEGDSPTPTRAAGLRSQPLFSPGELLAERYEIVRYIAQGGMGEVYEAEDRQLQTRVALKTVRPEIASDPGIRERFKREILLARRVTHPNVCRIFDVAVHQRPSGNGSESAFVFLTMELLEGETLFARIRRAGPFSTREARPILGQIVSALAAAHAASVVHRDVKCGNVMLVPTPEGGVRAVVTDFGLAREDKMTDAPDDPSQTLVGTVAYMSPEQILGGRVTPAADVYALGIVMFEMVTGRKPFSGQTVLSTVAQHLQGGVRSPRAFVPDLDPRWEQAMLRCLERDASRRFTRVEDVLHALDEPGRWRRRAPLLGLGAVLTLLTAWWMLREPAPTPASQISPPPGPERPALEPRRAVAVLGFKNLTTRTEDTWLSTALSEMLATELSAGVGLRVVPGDNVARAQAGIAALEGQSLGPETLARLRASLGSDVVIQGSYLTLGQGPERRLRVDLRLQDTATGELIATFAESGREQELFDLILGLGLRVRERLSAHSLSAEATAELRRSVPVGLSAQRAYAEALTRLRRTDAMTARAFFEQAIAADPDFPLAHAGLAEAWSALGYDERAVSAAKRAFDLAARLPREERLSVEARYHEASRQWAQAIDIYRLLTDFFPDNIEYGLRLAAAQTSAGQVESGLRTLEGLRRLPAPAGQDARIDLAEADAAAALSDFKRALASAERAAAKGAARNERALVAKARLREGWALERMGDVERALGAIAEAQRLYTAIGHRGGAAWALRNRAFLLAEQGQLEKARALQEEALGIFRDIGDRRGQAATSNMQGAVLWALGDATGAKLRYGEALASFRAMGDRAGMARALGNLARVAQQREVLKDASALYEEARAIFVELGDKAGLASVMNALGQIARARGDLPAAQRHFEEALALYTTTGQRRNRAAVLHELGRALHARGDLPAARTRLAEALALRQVLGNPAEELESRLGLVELAFDEQPPGPELAQLEGLVRGLDPASERDSGAQIYLLLAYQQQKSAPDQAQAAARRALDLARQGKDVAAAAMLMAQAAGIQARGPVAGLPALVTRLERLAAQARREGRVELELQTALALAEIDAARHPGSAATKLQGVAQRCRAQGFERLARAALRSAEASRPPAR
jgi:serine/threonine protein kinase/tetratricopeptide (TPR) repeat protein